MHVVLLGDSIFDNASYTRGEPDVGVERIGLVLVDVQQVPHHAGADVQRFEHLLLHGGGDRRQARRDEIRQPAGLADVRRQRLQVVEATQEQLNASKK